MHGQGVATHTDGRKYVGAFKDDKYHGQGVETFPDGKVQKGTFENGEYVGWPTVPETSKE